MLRETFLLTYGFLNGFLWLWWVSCDRMYLRARAAMAVYPGRASSACRRTHAWTRTASTVLTTVLSSATCSKSAGSRSSRTRTGGSPLLLATESSIPFSHSRVAATQSATAVVTLSLLRCRARRCIDCPLGMSPLPSHSVSILSLYLYSNSKLFFPQALLAVRYPRRESSCFYIASLRRS